MTAMAEDSKAIISRLHTVLAHLKENPYPYVPTPQGCKKRASVAVIVRVRPKYAPVAVANGSVVELQPPDSHVTSLDEFFAQKWVQEGDAEILFIKRAGRAGDRWSGHVALPGGKRDPEDEDDAAAAIRETREEVGLDISGSDCLRAGNLPERVVATTWGKAPLMVLCPYIFVFTTRHVPPVQPQPTEVASAHWVPLRALLAKQLRTSEYVDTASRMAKQGGWLAQKILRFLVGRMVFSAVRLAPAESVYASSIPGFIPEKDNPAFTGLARGAFGISSSTEGLTHQQPLLLWGLTLGVLADFLDMLPPYNAVKLWHYPTFTPPDLRLFIWIVTRKLRQDNAGELSAGTWPSQTASDAATTATAVTEAEPIKAIQEDNEVGIGGLGVGSNPKHATGRMLSGYYDRVNMAIGLFLAYRTILGSTAIYWLYRSWRKRQSSR